MYTYDEVIASGYFVFKEKLSKDVISTFITIRKSIFDEKFTRNDLKLNKLKDFIKFNNPYYELKDEKTINDLMPFTKLELIVLFQAIEEELDKDIGQKVKTLKS